MLSVTQIARQCRLSRTTILYYEHCGLLKPARRSAANYRLYGEKEVHTLEQVCLYRSVGISVRDIRLMLAAPQSHAVSLLKRRLQELDSEIGQLRSHQTAILRLLRSKNLTRRTKKMTKEKWVSIMQGAGFGEADMHRWHQEFERSDPQEHEQFLQYLHIPEKEIQTIREWSRK